MPQPVSGVSLRAPGTGLSHSHSQKGHTRLQQTGVAEGAHVCLGPSLQD